MNIKEACNMYGLQIQQVESNVFQVVNTNKELNVDKFIRDLNNCIVITNFSRKYNKDVTNTCWNISNIYYIVTDYSLDRLAYKYLQHAKAEHGGKIVTKKYRYEADLKDSIDTVFSQEELGRL